MKYTAYFLTLIFVVLTITVACDSKEKVLETKDIDSNKPFAIHSDVDSKKYDSSVDLNTPNFFNQFIKYFDMDEDTLIQTLQKDFNETPDSGKDQSTGSIWLKLYEAGLVFHLTEEEGIPVSDIEIEDSSPINFKGLRGKMQFSDIMKQAGETMITAQSDSESGRRFYSITYPLEGVSVIFTTENIFEDSAKMTVSSWGYYDNEPTLLSPNVIQNYYGAFTLPDSWKGRIALEEIGDSQTVLYLGKEKEYPLIKLVSFNMVEWIDMSNLEQKKYEMVVQNEDWVIVTQEIQDYPSDDREKAEYEAMEKEVEAILRTFEVSEGLRENNENVESTTIVCSDSIIELTDVDQIVNAIEESFLENSSDFSEAALDEYYAKVGNCFSREVDKSLVNNSSLKELVTSLRLNISKIHDAWYELRYIAEGGGTMWSHFSSRQGSVIDAPILMYLRRLEMENGQILSEDRFNELITKLSDFRDAYKNNSLEALYTEDEEKLSMASEKLVKSYDDLLVSLEMMPKSEASVELLEFLTRYSYKK